MQEQKSEVGLHLGSAQINKQTKSLDDIDNSSYRQTSVFVPIFTPLFLDVTPIYNFK